MNWQRLFLSFDGRLNRKRYWIGILVLIAVAIVCFVIFAAAGGLIGLAVAYLLLLYPSLALGAKRLHDRNRPAAWLLIFFVLPGVLQALAVAVGDPFFGGLLNLVGFGLSVWAFVELGCLRGTVGPNRYGPDPLGTPALAGV